MNFARLFVAALLALYLFVPLSSVSANQPSEKRSRVEISAFGVKGDGKNNDTSAFQTALGKLKSNQYLHLPSGTYLIDTLTLPSGVMLVGEKDTIIKGRSSGAELLQIASDHVTLSNLVLDGNQKRKTALILNNAHSVLLQNCEIRNFAGDAKATARALIVKGGGDIALSNSYFHGIRSESVGNVRAISAWNVESLSIIGCTFKDVGSLDSGDCVQINGKKDWLCDLTIKDCTFDAFNRRAIKLQTSGGKILHNRITANPATDETPNAQAAIAVFADNNRIENNLITLHNSRLGIDLNGSHCSVRNNTIVADKSGRNKQTSGIRVSAFATYSSIEQNTIRNIPNALDVNPKASGVSVNGNVQK
ncbi:right-handed parallel beta-helix repeat-containing protein [Azotosporobacter soli]|uniref:right-handed parallel beta-helix repeat-containing protein n=1 Tax=Azotosporobacter soli TaxID=3055040 RepID=UPI0031FE5DE3